MGTESAIVESTATSAGPQVPNQDFEPFANSELKSQSRALMGSRDFLEEAVFPGLSTCLTNCNQHVHQSWPASGISFPLASRSSPNSPAAESASLPRAGGCLRGVGLCVGKTLRGSEDAGQRGEGRAFVNRQGAPGTARASLGSAHTLPGLALCPEPSLPSQAGSGSLHKPLEA